MDTAEFPKSSDILSAAIYLGHIECSTYSINEMMPFAATWMGIEIVILSEENQTEKEKYLMTFLICGI